MSDYRKVGGPGGRKSGFGARKPSFGFRGGDRGEGAREMFPATCSSCHQSCEIPFRPSGDRPVYCRNCFGAQEGTSSGVRGQRDDRGGVSRSPRRDFAQPFISKPLVDDRRLDDLKRQLDAMSVKLDRIITVLAPESAPVVVEEKKTSKKKADAEGVRVAVAHVIADIKKSKKEAALVDVVVSKPVKKKTTKK